MEQLKRTLDKNQNGYPSISWRGSGAINIHVKTHHFAVGPHLDLSMIAMSYIFFGALKIWNVGSMENSNHGVVACGRKADGGQAKWQRGKLGHRSSF